MTLVSTTEIADRWNISSRTVRNHARIGIINAVRVGRAWAVDLEDADRVFKEHGADRRKRLPGRDDQ
jgi:Helix-turn-helix domain